MLASRKFRTPKARKRERVRRLVLSASAVALLLTLCGASVYVANMDTFRVARVEVRGALSDQQTELEERATELLAGTYLGILPKDNIAFVRKDVIAGTLYTADARLKDVRADLKRMRLLVIEVENRSPTARWCGEAVPPIAYAGQAGDTTASSTGWGRCYLMDDASFIYEAENGDGQELSRYYGPLAKAEPVGQAFVDGAEFARFTSLRLKLSKLGYPTSAMLLVDDDQAELYLADGTRLLVRRNAVVEELVNELTALAKTPGWRTDGSIEYVDLRWDGKAYYRYRDGS